MSSVGLPSPAEEAQNLLDLLRSEDDQFLWELYWDLARRFPDAAHDDKLALVRQVVWQLLTDGLIKLWRLEWPNPPHELLGPAEIERLRIDPLPWYDPNNTDLLVMVCEPGLADSS
jgi:hypothetical protein